MKEFLAASFFLLSSSLSFVNGINWNGNNWALGCDFSNNDLSNAQVKGNIGQDVVRPLGPIQTMIDITEIVVN